MIISTVVSSVLAYIGTSIDDIFINMLLFSQAESRKQSFYVIAGKYIGTGLLVAAACLGAYGLQSAAGQYTWALGFVPVLLGLKAIKDSRKGEEESISVSDSRNLVLNTAILTIASGADNIGVYIPLFAAFAPWQLAVMAAVFAVMTALWCFLSARLAGLPVITGILKKHRHIIVPAVYISLGIYIIFR